MWCHSQCLDFRRTAKIKKRAKEEKKKQILKAELELEMANQTTQETGSSEATGGGVQAGKSDTNQTSQEAGGSKTAGGGVQARKADFVSIEF